MKDPPQAACISGKTRIMDEHLRLEFNEWARAGRGEGMEKGHRPVGEQAIERMRVPTDARVLDVGCGDGQISRLIQLERPDLQLTGIDIIKRDTQFFPVAVFDGTHIPEPDVSQDVVILLDVLHHCVDPEALIREAQRVARRAIL